MNKKRYLILIALVIFVFLALFTFANPLNNKEDVKDNKETEEKKKDVIEKEELEKDEEKEIIEIKPVVVPQYNNHGVTINKVEKEEKDNSYDLALKAVKKVENTLSEEDLSEATKLVEKVTDKTKKRELEKRLSSVLEIIDLTNIVNTIVEDVKNASSKEDMDSVRNYAVKNDIGKRVNSLSNEVIRNLLIEKLETIVDLVEDTTCPTINIEDGAILDSETKITVTDDNEVTIILNEEEIDNNETVANGVYTLTATDAAFNTKIINFIVDTMAPEIKVTYANGTTYITGEDVTELVFYVYQNDELKYTYNSVENDSEKTFSLSTTELDAGEYVVKATDKFGRKSTINMYIAEDLKTAFDYTDTVVLYEDIELDTDEQIIITSGENKVIDLNGNKITGKSTTAATSNLIQVNTGASLRLEGDGEISFLATKPDTDWGENGSKPYPGYANNTIKNSGKLIIDGPSIINETGKGGASYAIDNYPGADLEVIDGTITHAGGGVAIRLFANSTTVTTKVTISGGTISGCRAIWLQLPGSNPASEKLADLIITGGTFTIIDPTVDNAIYSYSYGDSFAKTNITISGGIFNGDVGFGGGYKGDQENVTITGGTFNGEVGRYLANNGWESLK